MDLDRRLEQTPEIVFLRQCEEEQRVQAEYDSAWARDDVEALRLAADRLMILHHQAMAYVMGNVEPYRDQG
jgi:hypothetical protein